MITTTPARAAIALAAALVGGVALAETTPDKPAAAPAVVERTPEATPSNHPEAKAARATQAEAMQRAGGDSATLRPASAFAATADPKARSVALFNEMAKVITHPRCTNCHPATERPLQGDTQRPHMPYVVRGKDGHGAPGLRCESCHGTDGNYGRVPGAPHWHLAPAEMAWVGKTIPEICAQLKDPERNGGKTMDAMHDHMANDKLVAYGWNPPAHLEPAPGSQQMLGDLFRAWVDAGAHCPE